MSDSPATPRRVSRRGLLTGGAMAAGGALAGAGALTAVRSGTAGVRPDDAVPVAQVGSAVEPFHGTRQSGVTTDPQAHAAFVAFTLRPGTDRAALGRMLRLLSDDAARLTQGRPALADTEPELSVLPARLTVTFGFGPGLYAAAGLDDRRPTSVADLPAFGIDRLQPRWSGGDLLLQICADDPLTVAHAQRVLVKDSRPFAVVRWVQQGFRRAAGAEPGRTQRNLFGQLDGTANPKPGSPADTAVWVTDGPDWLRDSTTLVVRRISMNLETWDLLGRADRELAVGRRLDTGAPLTGRAEHDEPDFAALGPDGLTVIPDFSHLTRARVTDDRQKILRRPYNYDGVPTPEGDADSGLVFASYQADIAAQFLPIQRRLAERDLLNEWTTPIGSAVFAVPPGCPEGGWIGRQLLG
ncbi:MULTISPECIES: Dyp-type peroxidase [unclassified Micromonospora]|uniref:Dyp-type peroxidase n=1 Tax=unclassified Micromonospora TaxID=2617518 RepID=UPI0018905004|nr:MULTISPECIES: Dyp-type peroxidase [unclassified Micromonospora]MBF5028890.1 Dyp-type peroxidase [Micromonospora sp. ANENR4]MCZ7475981.1 Dyp-type peroxidase [Micromonospora sp. WMMC273]WBC00845.1 Dyp-type peroxidase [Micromonospora sp. WMMA1976]